jgi:glc operon protein GlcG
VTTAPNGIDLAAAEELLDAGVAFASERGLHMAIAVVDLGGHPVIMVRMDGASILAAESVVQKARTAAWLGRPTSSAVTIGKEWPHVYLSSVAAAQGAITLSMGGFPIVRRDGTALGAIGAAGGTGEQDAQVALAALRAGGYKSDPSTWPSGPDVTPSSC